MKVDIFPTFISFIYENFYETGVRHFIKGKQTEAMVVLESFCYLQSYCNRKLHQLKLIKTTSCFGYQGPSMTDWTKSCLWLFLGSPIPALVYCLYAAYTR